MRPYVLLALLVAAVVVMAGCFGPLDTEIPSDFLVTDVTHWFNETSSNLTLSFWTRNTGNRTHTGAFIKLDGDIWNENASRENVVLDFPGVYGGGGNIGKIYLYNDVPEILPGFERHFEITGWPRGARTAHYEGPVTTAWGIHEYYYDFQVFLESTPGGMKYISPCYGPDGSLHRHYDPSHNDKTRPCEEDRVYFGN